MERGGIAIELPKHLRGKAECWQDADEILGTIWFLNRRGKLRAATTGTPASRSTETLIECCGAQELEDAASALPAMAQSLASRQLITLENVP